MRSIKPIIMLGLLLVSSHVYSGITKWTDADGKVHYSDQPAPKNVNATNINIEDPIPVAPDAKEKLQSYQNVIEEGRKKRLLEDQEQEKIAADKKAAAAKATKAAAEAAKNAQNDAPQQNLNSGSSATPDAAGYTGYGGYTGYTPLAAPAAQAPSK
ncbi:MAG TPA: DUF4124 domain-containing protein [Methyloradius sp.]